jgi:hypothetical protein
MAKEKTESSVSALWVHYDDKQVISQDLMNSPQLSKYFVVLRMLESERGIAKFTSPKVAKELKAKKTITWHYMDELERLKIIVQIQLKEKNSNVYVPGENFFDNQLFKLALGTINLNPTKEQLKKWGLADGTV